MCSIYGSFDIEKFKELRQSNLYRGSRSHSFAVFDGAEDFKFLSLTRSKEIINVDNETNVNNYYLGHSQAPTSQGSRIHPADNDKNDEFLWHNGIIKEGHYKGDWDTQYILDRLDDGWYPLSEINGSFACFLYRRGNCFIFRNEIAPLFIDDNINISSTKFANSKILEPNKVFYIDFVNKKINHIADFKTKDNPYTI